VDFNSNKWRPTLKFRGSIFQKKKKIKKVKNNALEIEIVRKRIEIH
jgi:hypothetical protein